MAQTAADDEKRGTGENAIDREFAGEHGTTALPGSLREEEHPEVDAQTPGGAMQKAAAEVSEGSGLLDKAKRALEEADRQLSGEYERREDPAAAEPGQRLPVDGEHGAGRPR